MSAWPGKFVIGLTGNIATGKSVVRKMLEHLGAYGIDADALGHRAIANGAPGYKPLVDAFGKWVVGADGEIDRSKLGKVVFSDPEALEKLEAIVHPLVRQAIDHLIKKSTQNVIVIEAIKLLETPLRNDCDRIWVTTAREETQLSRLVKKRGMDKATAKERMDAQSPQEDKILAANTMIHNDGTFEETWKRVKEAWKDLFPEAAGDTVPVKMATTSTASVDELVVLRARPRQADEIAKFITRHSGGRRKMRRDDVMAAFGEKAYLLLMAQDRLVGLVGWQVENLVSRTDEFYLEEGLSKAEAIPFLISEVEQASRELQSEASLIFVEPEVAKAVKVWSTLGYEVRYPASLSVNAWQEAARESMVDGSVMLFKQLRVDRVLRPI